MNTNAGSIRHVPIGGVEFGRAGDELRAVLGSCVGITLWSPALQIGSLCHIQLPRRTKRVTQREPDGRFAEEAWALMCRGLALRGVRLDDCLCGVFGGAHVVPFVDAPVGERNLEHVREMLDHHEVEVGRLHVAGTGYRELRFVIASGDILVRHHPATSRIEGVTT